MSQSSDHALFCIYISNVSILFLTYIFQINPFQSIRICNGDFTKTFIGLFFSERTKPEFIRNETYYYIQWKCIERCPPLSTTYELQFEIRY